MDIKIGCHVFELFCLISWGIQCAVRIELSGELRIWNSPPMSEGWKREVS